MTSGHRPSRVFCRTPSNGLNNKANIDFATVGRTEKGEKVHRVTSSFPGLSPFNSFKVNDWKCHEVGRTFSLSAGYSHLLPGLPAAKLGTRNRPLLRREIVRYNSITPLVCADFEGTPDSKTVYGTNQASCKAD